MDNGQVVYIDMFSKPYTDNTFDNLPPSQAVPNTYSTRLPKKLQFFSMSVTDSDDMLSTNCKSLFLMIETALKTIQGGNTLIYIDNLNMILDGCAGTSALEFIEVLNDLKELADRASGVTMAFGVNRDLILDELTLKFYREMKNSDFNMVFELNRNLSGYTKDVHGQLNIIKNNGDDTPVK